MPKKIDVTRSEEHTSELQSPCNLACRLLLEKKKIKRRHPYTSPDNQRTHGETTRSDRDELARSWHLPRRHRCHTRAPRPRDRCFFFLMIRRPPRSPLFPYRPLFR